MATLVVNPVPATTVDGFVGLENSSTDWATVRDATDGNVNNYTNVDNEFALAVFNSGSGNYSIKRGFLLFDTSALGAGATITAAVLGLAGNGDAEQNADSTALHAVSCNPASNTALANADYDQVGSTSYGSINLSSWNETLGTFNDITFNSDGLAAISTISITKIGLRIARDLNNSAPTGNNWIRACSSDNGTAARHPKLTITYTPATANFFQLF